MNSILAIHPYKSGSTWMFDDPSTGLNREPFIAGADTIIDRMVEDIPEAASGVTLLASETQFPGHQYELVWQRAEADGNWYFCPQFSLEGWLCPALFLYFPTAPKRIFVQVKPGGRQGGRTD